MLVGFRGHVGAEPLPLTVERGAPMGSDAAHRRARDSSSTKSNDARHGWSHRPAISCSVIDSRARCAILSTVV